MVAITPVSFTACGPLSKSSRLERVSGGMIAGLRSRQPRHPGIGQVRASDHQAYVRILKSASKFVNVSHLTIAAIQINDSHAWGSEPAIAISSYAQQRQNLTHHPSISALVGMETPCLRRSSRRDRPPCSYRSKAARLRTPRRRGGLARYLARRGAGHRRRSGSPRQIPARARFDWPSRGCDRSKKSPASQDSLRNR